MGKPPRKRNAVLQEEEDSAALVARAGLAESRATSKLQSIDPMEDEGVWVILAEGCTATELS